MDWPFPGFVNTKWQMPATLSVIPLPAVAPAPVRKPLCLCADACHGHKGWRRLMVVSVAEVVELQGGPTGSLLAWSASPTILDLA